MIFAVEPRNVNSPFNYKFKWTKFKREILNFRGEMKSNLVRGWRWKVD